MTKPKVSEDDERCFALGVMRDGSVFIAKDGYFTGLVEAAQWIERFVGASSSSPRPGCVTMATAEAFVARQKLLMAEPAYRLTVVEAIREREQAKLETYEATNVEVRVDGKKLPGPVTATVTVAAPDRSEMLFMIVRARMESALKKHGAFASDHEVHSVLLEEVEEFFDEVRCDGSKVRRITELLDVATAAMRRAIELANSLPYEPSQKEIEHA